MSDNDTELFDLCNQVYEKTGWGGTVQFICNDEVFSEGEYEDYGMSFNFDADKGHIPLYTSDYLLDKLHLTNRTDREKYHIGIIVGRDIHGNKAVSASAQDTGWIIQEGGDTLLIALLKLTLTLHKQGRI